MANQSSWAITINLNPLSYVTLPVNGKKCRKKWQDHAQSDQRFFLTSFVNLLQRQQVKAHDMDYTFEVTEKGNIHLHMRVACPYVCVESAKNDFCLLVRKSIPQPIKDRMVLIKPQTSSGWNTYIHKLEDPDIDDTPIEIPKHNLFIKRLKKA